MLTETSWSTDVFLTNTTPGESTWNLYKLQNSEIPQVIIYKMLIQMCCDMLRYMQYLRFMRIQCIVVIKPHVEQKNDKTSLSTNDD